MREERRFLYSRKEEIQQALLAHLPPLDDSSSPLIQAMHYSVLSDGKRLRPILLLEGAALFGVPTDSALSPACAVEFIHCYSLIHDDLPCMDDDDLRRGQPTLHRIYGEDMAVLTGDALLTLSFDVLASSLAPPSTAISLVKELAIAAGYRGMVAGQVADLQAEGKSISREELEYIHEHKTGALLTCPLRMAAHLGEASGEDLSRLTRFGQSLGLLFQVTDDILDVVGETNIMGKRRGADRQQKKATFPGLMGLDASRELALHLEEKAVDFLRPFGEKAENLITLTQFVRQRNR